MKRRTFFSNTVAGAAAVGLSPHVPLLGEQQAARTAVIDAHCHAGHGLNFGKPGGPYEPWSTYNDPEETLQKMEEAGIDRTVIFPIKNTTYKEANEEIASYVRRWPAKLIGFAKHDSNTEKGRIADMLRHEVRELGLCGLKLHGTPSEEMMTAAAELKIPILFHPRRVDDCHIPLRSHPEVNFILAHLGSFASRQWQDHDRAIEVTERYPNLYLETSAVNYFLYLEKAARLLSPNKLLFGSDGPLVDSRIELQKIKTLNLAPEAEQQVLGGNILRLLGEHA